MQESRPRGGFLATDTLEIRPSHAGKEQGVAREHSRAIKQIRSALGGVTRGLDRLQFCRTKSDSVAAGQWSEAVPSSTLGRQSELHPLEFGQLPRSREMVSMNVRIDDRDRTPTPLAK